jgi:hypothetical protein
VVVEFHRRRGGGGSVAGGFAPVPDGGTAGTAGGTGCRARQRLCRREGGGAGQGRPTKGAAVAGARAPGGDAEAMQEKGESDGGAGCKGRRQRPWWRTTAAALQVWAQGKEGQGAGLGVKDAAAAALGRGDAGEKNRAKARSRRGDGCKGKAGRRRPRVQGRGAGFGRLGLASCGSSSSRKHREEAAM